VTERDQGIDNRLDGAVVAVIDIDAAKRDEAPIGGTKTTSDRRPSGGRPRR
jgi:hypothetical protein